MESKNIGFISTRLAGTDGVSLETAKWARVLEEEGHSCFFMAGELDTDEGKSLLVPEAHFTHPEVENIYELCFGHRRRPPEITDAIHDIKDTIKKGIREFIKMFEIDMIVPENALTIPMNIPLGLALAEVISETAVPAIAHHHDFFWERKRFLTNSIWDYLNMAFPPHLPFIKHVCINSSGDNQLSLRTGISSTVIPNVMDFDQPPPPPDGYADDLRDTLGFSQGEKFILQATRVIQRKGIEHAIELVHRLNMKAKLVISHASGDEGFDYERRVREYAELLNVDTLFLSDIVGDERTALPDGRKVYSLADLYHSCDLVTYPSTFEGFGNGFLEAVYYKKPIMVNNYSIYAIDIKPKGFRTIEMEDFISENNLELTRRVLTNPDLARDMAEHNYLLGRKHFSHSLLRQKLNTLMGSFFGFAD